MKLQIYNRQRVLKLDRKALRRLLTWLIGQMFPTPERWSDMAVTVTDDAGMAAANQSVFGRSGPTDVISVTYRPGPGLPDWSAEVFVNAERALAEGGRHGGVERELALYLAHGLQHAAGASDRTAAGRKRMRRKEQAWLADAQQKGYLHLQAKTPGVPRP